MIFLPCCSNLSTHERTNLSGSFFVRGPTSIFLRFPLLIFKPWFDFYSYSFVLNAKQNFFIYSISIGNFLALRNTELIQKIYRIWWASCLSRLFFKRLDKIYWYKQRSRTYFVIWMDHHGSSIHFLQQREILPVLQDPEMLELSSTNVEEEIDGY